MEIVGNVKWGKRFMRSIIGLCTEDSVRVYNFMEKGVCEMKRPEKLLQNRWSSGIIGTQMT